MKKNKAMKRKRLIILSLCAVLATVLFLIVFFYTLYNMSKQNIIAKYRAENYQIAGEVSQYLTMPMDAVAFSAVTINGMLQENADSDEVWKYLINETKIYSSIISENNTGVYAYYKGEYLDGSQWDPPEDYDPEMRPWYTAAVEARGNIALVKPFLNLQTNTMMMSVSQLLIDQTSVVSMDIFLDSVQRMVEEAVNENGIKACMVVDKGGLIVAHSDSGLAGVDITTNDQSLEYYVLSDVNNITSYEYDLFYGGIPYRVFSQSINKNWEK